jgi:hypothetical protein
MPMKYLLLVLLLSCGKKTVIQYEKSIAEKCNEELKGPAYLYYNVLSDECRAYLRGRR